VQSLASHWKKICALFALHPACPGLTDREELFQEELFINSSIEK
jgi:hypothetical protein